MELNVVCVYRAVVVEVGCVEYIGVSCLGSLSDEYEVERVNDLVAVEVALDDDVLKTLGEVELPPVDVEEVALAASENEEYVVNACHVAEVGGNGLPCLPAASGGYLDLAYLGAVSAAYVYLYSAAAAVRSNAEVSRLSLAALEVYALEADVVAVLDVADVLSALLAALGIDAALRGESLSLDNVVC